MDKNASVLHKVRALLAKAEATPFDAEAEAFTAKAQELIARHRIDRALLEARAASDRGTPVARRIEVEDPYLKAKVILLSNVAGANDCRAVWLKPLRYVEMVGYADDLDSVEELFTSLLLQATAALHRAGSKQDVIGRSRTTAFRRAFLTAFAVRIGQRLRAAVDVAVTVAAAESGVALVPILAARSEAVQALARETFPHTRPIRATVTDADGWHAGSAFADQADLAVHSKLARGA
ncbi:MAG: DUF2786 domain-containing protein [Actinomycetota bacterium]|nr:DUF2786 domain-containing protein [Actinomycetota bacterium]